LNREPEDLPLPEPTDTMRVPHATDMKVPAPDFDEVAAEYDRLEARLEAAGDQETRLAVIWQWDGLRRRLDSWRSLTHLRFNQETDNDEYRTERERCDELTPRLTRLDVSLKRRLLASPHRPALEERLGAQAFALWESDVMAFEPIIEEDLVQEARLEAEYVELLARARILFRGEKLNLPEIRRYATGPDRDTRHEAEQARWAWFTDHAGELDRIFDELVRLRTSMAHKLGLPSFVELGYRRMQRIDYDAADVARFRAQVQQHVVPLAATLRQRQAARLGVERLCFWDEAVHDPMGNPDPRGDHDWMLARAQEMFDAMHPELASFFAMMRDRGLLDLQARDGKSDGGFCTGFPIWGVPFIFGSFNGSKADVEVFTHESGHAFQFYRSGNMELLDYVWPTAESCEVHSMGLEFLTWPHMERFFGERAERYRRNHLADALLFLPYGTAVDHFQHRVYERPEASPAERREMWRELERTYLPWRRYRDLAHPAAGGFWQLQRHIYINPFYYIDYCLAQTCALQLWIRSRENDEATLDAYVALCNRGGRLPFQALVRSAGLSSPFDDGVLERVVGQSQDALETLPLTSTWAGPAARGQAPSGS
jgi:M3 family oligoendopeptidase